MLGLITGSGFHDVPQLIERRVVHHATPFGNAELTFGRWRNDDDSPAERPVVFLARHGPGHSSPPHAINYRANVWALHDVGAEAILATAVSGGISPRMTPGTLVIIDDFLNFTSGRADTFFDRTVRHTDMTDAYDPRLRSLVAEAARAEGIDVVDGGTYCAFDGPRFESPAEIRMAGIVGGDLVGMTGYPEVALARELGVPYASIGVISNPAAGLVEGELSMEMITATLADVAGPLFRLVGRTIELYR